VVVVEPCMVTIPPYLLLYARNAVWRWCSARRTALLARPIGHVPTPGQQQSLETADQAEQPDTHERENEDRREHAGREELGAVALHQVAQPLAGPDELPEDRRDHADGDPDSGPREDRRQGRWQLRQPEAIPASGT